jgi:accessory gene regulator protein AgrB
MKVPAWITVPPLAGKDGTLESAADDDGVTGNTRLTSATGLVLLILLAVEGVTILSVRQMITLHVFVGIMLLGPVLLKTGSTVYRFVRYYSGAPTYQKKGPPHPLLRVLGPFVILSSLALLGSGIALIVVGTQGSGWLLVVHQTCFWVWVAVMAVHLVGHLWESVVTAWTEIRSALSGKAARQRRRRYIVIALALVLGTGTAMVLLPTAAPWTTRQVDHHTGSGVHP